MLHATRKTGGYSHSRMDQQRSPAKSRRRRITLAMCCMHVRSSNCACLCLSLQQHSVMSNAPVMLSASLCDLVKHHEARRTIDIQEMLGNVICATVCELLHVSWLILRQILTQDTTPQFHWSTVVLRKRPSVVTALFVLC